MYDYSVTEDYAPFNVDVTTEKPAVLGPRTAIASITHSVSAEGLLMPSDTAGGVSYVNVFARSNYLT